MYEIGKTEDNPDAKGLGFLTQPTIKDCVTDFKTYSNRVIKMKVHLQGNDSVTVINAYAPTSCVEDEKVEHLYDDIKRAIADSDSKYKIIPMQKLELKQKKKTAKHGSICNRGEK